MNRRRIHGVFAIGARPADTFVELPILGLPSAAVVRREMRPNASIRKTMVPVVNEAARRRIRRRPISVSGMRRSFVIVMVG